MAFAIILFVLLLCLALTYSRGAWLSLAAIVLGLTLFYDKRFGFLFFLIPLVLLFYHGQMVERFLSLFSGEDTSVGLRFALWESTIAMIEEHPLLGVGWGSYYLAIPTTISSFRMSTSHLPCAQHVSQYARRSRHHRRSGLPSDLLRPGLPLLEALSGKVSLFTRTMGLGGLLMVMAIAVLSMSDHVLFGRSISFCFWSLSALCVGSGDW